MTTLTLINIDTDEILLSEDFAPENLSQAQAMWATQVELYKLENPPINARLEIENEDDDSPEE